MAPFDERLKGLRDSANTAYQSVSVYGVAPWYRVSPANPDDHAEVSDSFNRRKQEEEYTKSIDDLGQVRLMQASKLQSDVLAAMERDYRMRHRSRVRMMAHASARLATHGSAGGPIGRIDKFIGDIRGQQKG